MKKKNKCIECSKPISNKATRCRLCANRFAAEVRDFSGKKNPFYGKQHSVETKEKNRIAHIGKNSWWWGKRHSLETKEKIRQANIGKFVSETTKLKIRENHADFTKEKHPQWKGGISLETYPSSFNKKLKHLIRLRDNFICQECKTHEDKLNRKLHIHHIDFDKENCSENNLISLCHSCHSATNFNREYWKNKWLKEENDKKKD